MKNDKIIGLIQRAYDLHVHVGPEIIPRKYMVQTLVTSERGKIAGMALKNHFYSTTPFIAETNPGSVALFGSIVLNNFVGGLNPEAVYATRLVTDKPFIVWFPTTSAKQFLKNSTWEIAPEWVKVKGFQARRAATVQPISIFDSDGNISNKCLSVLLAIKQTNAILATGHISWQESTVLVKKAIAMGIRKIIITHPIYQRINMPIQVQQKLARYDAKIEICWSMWKIDNIPLKKIARQIKEIGAKNCILSSDTGQAFSPSPSDALYEFATALRRSGITIKELRIMLIDNPKGIISM